MGLRLRLPIPRLHTLVHDQMTAFMCQVEAQPHHTFLDSAAHNDQTRSMNRERVHSL